MTFDYVYEAADFTNATTLDIEDIQEKIDDLALSSATILYINGGNDLVQIFFSNELSGGDKTTLDSFVANYTDLHVYTDTSCKVLDIKSPGTNGGTFEKDIWTTRELNTIEGNVDFASLSNNVITLQPGKYIIDVRAPSCDVGSNQIRLRNLTTNEYILGMNTYSTGGIMVMSNINQYLTLDEITEFSIQHICTIRSRNIGFGRAVGYGTNEIYTTVFIQKITTV